MTQKRYMPCHQDSMPYRPPLRSRATGFAEAFPNLPADPSSRCHSTSASARPGQPCAARCMACLLHAGGRKRTTLLSTMLRLAWPSSTFATRDAKLSEQSVSDAHDSLGLSATNMSTFALPPANAAPTARVLRALTGGRSALTRSRRRPSVGMWCIVCSHGIGMLAGGTHTPPVGAPSGPTRSAQ